MVLPGRARDPFFDERVSIKSIISSGPGAKASLSITYGFISRRFWLRDRASGRDKRRENAEGSFFLARLFAASVDEIRSAPIRLDIDPRRERYSRGVREPDEPRETTKGERKVNFHRRDAASAGSQLNVIAYLSFDRQTLSVLPARCSTESLLCSLPEKISLGPKSRGCFQCESSPVPLVRCSSKAPVFRAPRASRDVSHGSSFAAFLRTAGSSCRSRVHRRPVPWPATLAGNDLCSRARAHRNRRQKSLAFFPRFALFRLLRSKISGGRRARLCPSRFIRPGEALPWFEGERKRGARVEIYHGLPLSSRVRVHPGVSVNRSGKWSNRSVDPCQRNRITSSPSQHRPRSRPNANGRRR